MKMKWNFTFTGQGCQLAARSLKLHALVTLRSIDSCQNGTCEDHYQITNNVGSNIHDLTFPYVNPASQPRLKCLTNTRTQQSVYSKIRHSNEFQLTAVKLQHPLTIITGPYRGLRYRPIELEFFEVIRWQVFTFRMITGSSSFFLTHTK